MYRFMRSLYGAFEAHLSLILGIGLLAWAVGR